MNRNEALEAMNEGKKVTHTYFSSEEYLHLVNKRITTEDGHHFKEQFYSQDMFKDGWSIYTTEDNPAKLFNYLVGSVLGLND